MMDDVAAERKTKTAINDATAPTGNTHINQLLKVNPVLQQTQSVSRLSVIV